MKRVIQDVLWELGVQNPHPEDIARVERRFFGPSKWDPVKLAVSAVWPFIFARYLRAKDDWIRARGYVRHREERRRFDEGHFAEED